MAEIDSGKLNELEKILGYKFRRRELLIKALTHSSADPYKNNERLEFVGDALLGFVVADYLASETDLDEGGMTNKRKALVNKKTLALIADENRLTDYIIKVKNLEASEKIKSSLFEALTAAVYYDGGEQPAKDFLMRFLKKHLSNEDNDYKSALFEACIKRFGAYPEEAFDAAENGLLFNVKLSINGRIIGEGSGKNKKEAEQAAAKSAIVAAAGLRPKKIDG